MKQSWKDDDDGFHLMAVVEIESIYIHSTNDPFNKLTVVDQEPFQFYTTFHP